MTSRERVRNIIARRPADRCAFWLGNPHPDSLPALHAYFGTSTLEDLHRTLGSDLRWLTPQFTEGTYRHPGGRGFFDVVRTKKRLGEPGPLAHCQTVREIEAYEWPEVGYLHFEGCLAALGSAGDVYRASGFWAPFFHDVMDLFGVEEFLDRLHHRPDLVDAVLAKVVGFYLEANDRFFAAAGGLVDGTFFGNDFGTQREVMIGPAQLDRFLLPWVRRIADQGRRHGLQVLLHSCGSVHRIVDRLIDAGIECLHPLQALAHNMDAETLARDFGGRIAFLGGIDTQELLVNGAQEDVRREVRRVKALLGPHLIVSPSHEALLPDVPPRNIAAMAEAALE